MLMNIDLLRDNKMQLVGIPQSYQMDATDNGI